MKNHLSKKITQNLHNPVPLETLQKTSWAGSWSPFSQKLWIRYYLKPTTQQLQQCVINIRTKWWNKKRGYITRRTDFIAKNSLAQRINGNFKYLIMFYCTDFHIGKFLWSDTTALGRPTLIMGKQKTILKLYAWIKTTSVLLCNRKITWKTVECWVM